MKIKQVLIIGSFGLLSMLSMSSHAQVYTGTLNYGTLDSSIETDDVSVGFLNNDKFGKKILKACNAEKKCQVDATLDKNGNIKALKSVKVVN